MAGVALLVAAPFALRSQAAGVGWTSATKTDVITGGVLAAAGFAGLFTSSRDRSASLPS